MFLPFVLGLSTAGAVAAFVLGALMVGPALAAGAGEARVGPHAAFDLVMAGGLVVAAVAVGLYGDLDALRLFVAVAFAQLALMSLTRYSARMGI